MSSETQNTRKFERVTPTQLGAMIHVSDGFYFGTVNGYSGLFQIEPETGNIISIEVGQQSHLSSESLINLLRSRLSMKQLQLILSSTAKE